MGHMNRRQGASVGAVLLALAMTACSGPAPIGPSPGPGSGAVSASPAGPDASAGPAAGGFGNVPAACDAVSSTTVSLLALPKAAATGKDSAEAEQARVDLEGIRDRVPADLKAHFEKLKSIADNAGQDYSRFNRGEFDLALAPIAGWLEAHC